MASIIQDKIKNKFQCSFFKKLQILLFNSSLFLLAYFLFYTHTHTRVSTELLSTELVLLFPAHLFVKNV